MEYLKKTTYLKGNTETMFMDSSNDFLLSLLKIKPNRYESEKILCYHKKALKEHESSLAINRWRKRPLLMATAFLVVVNIPRKSFTAV